MNKSEAGKGSLIRPCNWSKYGYNYERIFNPKCVTCGALMEQVAPHIRRFYCPECGGFEGKRPEIK